MYAAGRTTRRQTHRQPHEDVLTKLQQAAYDAQLAAGLPISPLARETMGSDGSPIDLLRCARYLHAVQHMDWFTAAFPGHTGRLRVTGGRGPSHADSQRRLVKIGAADRQALASCEQACLHELAHIVSCDHEPDGSLREPKLGRRSSKGHHHAWRANFVFIVRMVLGRPAASRLRAEFRYWGLPAKKQ